jgi:hypothetical protein
VAIAARICPNDVRLTLEQAIPGGMSLEDYSLMREDKLGTVVLKRYQPFSVARCQTSLNLSGPIRAML